MRLRFAALVLTAACGVVAPSRAAEPAADLGKYLPDGAGFYVHINVRDFLAAPVIRKAIPMAADKYDQQIQMGLQFAMMAIPNANNLPEEQIKQGLKALKDPKVIADAFDKAKDALTDIVVVGTPGDEMKTLVVIKCHEFIKPDLVKGGVAMIQGNPQFPIQLKAHEKGDLTIYEVSGPNQPQPAYVSVPAPGVICIGASKDVIDTAVAAKGGLKGDLKKLTGERKDTDFVFFAISGKGGDESAVVSGWGRLVLDKDISGEVSATYGNGKKAANEADEMNTHIGQLADMARGALGPAGKDVADALSKAKANVSGSTVTAKFSLPGTVVEKLLAKDKE
jgi:hypothetical protein